MDNHEKMHNGMLYDPSDDLVAEQALCLERQYDFNHSRPAEQPRRQQLLPRKRQNPDKNRPRCPAPKAGDSGVFLFDKGSRPPETCRENGAMAGHRRADAQRGLGRRARRRRRTGEFTHQAAQPPSCSSSARWQATRRSPTGRRAGRSAAQRSVA